MDPGISVFRKLIAGDLIRPTRFHDSSGHICGPIAAFGAAPSLATWVAARARGTWIQQPWWAWGATRFVASRITRNDKVLEIGSGYSSLWLARRCREVRSIEESPEWKEMVEKLATASGIGNLTVTVRPSLAGFEEIYKSGYSPEVVIVDAESRPEIFDRLISMAAPPRVIVYDDTDFPQYSQAPKIAAERGFTVRSFRGFKPQGLQVIQTSIMFRAGATQPDANR